MQRTNVIHGVLERPASLSALLHFSYLQLLDLLTTIAFLANGVSEGNPVVAFAIQTSGDPLIGLAGVKIVAVATGIYCWISGRSRLLKRANVCFAALVAWNLIALIVGSGLHA